MEFLEELILSRDNTIRENEFHFISDRLFTNSNPIFKRFARIESGRPKIRSIRREKGKDSNF